MIQNALGQIAFRPFLIAATLLAIAADADSADRFVRHRQPDRGTYQPPTIPKNTLRAPATGERFAEQSAPPPAPLPKPVAAVETTDGASRRSAGLPAPVVIAADPEPSKETVVRQVNFQTEPFPAPGINTSGAHREDVEQCSCQSCSSGGFQPTPLPPGEVIYDSGLPIESVRGDLYCDSYGCDSMPGVFGRRTGNARDRWFGSVELLLMFRKGDTLPPLVTTTTADTPEQDTAGRLDQDETVVIAGDQRVLEEMTAGGRLTIGTWLDRYKDRSLVARGWFAGEETFGFSANQDTHDVLTRPFFNVSDGVTPADDTLIIAFPDLASGNVSVHADSNVYGGDVSIRQLWHKGHGGTIDLLYGYQYMGLDESLRISSTSTSLDDDFNPVGSIRSVTDRFDVQNDFHGGQIGIATNYREGCWSFSSLAKVGFGSVRRRAELQGVDFRSIDGNNATDPNGLLVRSTNSGVHTDDTFGWVPELDFTLGWQYFPAFDVTFGYHIIAMTDALQVSGVVDPNLATNLAPTPTGAQRPSPIFRHDTFYVQGIHFGLSYIH